MRPPKRVAIDFDGTICEFLYPDIGPPKKGVVEAISAIRRLGYEVIIWSCRACHWDYDIYGGDPNQPVLERDNVKAMIAWLKKHGIEYDVIDDGTKGKPSADYYIDDKAIRFEDNWEQIAARVRKDNVRLALEGARKARVLPFRAKPKPVSEEPKLA